MAKWNYKLTEQELFRLVMKDMITVEQFNSIVERSKQREPGTFDEACVSVWLNKAKTIRLSSIWYYGGENFGDPYHFIAEISPLTTMSAWHRFVSQNALDWLFDRIPFTY
jgi:hypothetical protein